MVAGTRLYFGEYTFYPGGGHDPGLDQALAERAEELWDLLASDFLRKRHRGLVRLYTEHCAPRYDRDPGLATADTTPRQKAARATASHPPQKQIVKKGRSNFRPPRPEPELSAGKSKRTASESNSPLRVGSRTTTRASAAAAGPPFPAPTSWKSRD